ncbi:MAG: hypothetical protein HYV09_29130 [Deltaproteobacteria bacterium]|nr:hypothetical protein [Deltaproteobacteria bacterium]
MNRHISAFAFVVVALAGVGCSDDDSSGNNPNPSADTGVQTDTGGTPGDVGADTATACLKDVPSTYESPDYTTNAAAELSLRDRLKAIMDPMKAAEGDLTKKPTAAELKDLYAAGTPSLESLTTAYYAGKTKAIFDAFALAAGNTWTPAATPTGNGGKFGAYLYDAYGKDLRQQVEKGAFGATFYNRAAALAADKAGLSEAAIDKLVALYGAHPSFPQATEGVPNPDIWVAQYAKRRDDKTQATPGLYRRIKTSLITAKAAIKAKCDAERDAALNAFLLDWEKVELATVIFYLNDAAKKIEAATTADQQSSAIHAIGESMAFIHGFRQHGAATRKITDAQIDELLGLIGAPADGNATVYQLVTDTATALPKFKTAVGQVTTKIAGIYGFTEADVASYKNSY